MRIPYIFTILKKKYRYLWDNALLRTLLAIFMFRSIKFISFICFSLLLLPVFAQEDDGTENNALTPIQKGFQIGLYVGSLFANNYTASLHDGYGLDFNGDRNSFENSYLYNKIVLQYGGGYPGTTDFIAQELNVMHGEWNFQESDMPAFMRYQPAFLLGLQGRYSVDGKNVVLLNVNAAQLTANGSFTITTNPQYVPGQNAKTIREFKIKGMEQRLIFQLGYQHLFGQGDKVHFLLEGGVNITMAKLSKNLIQINTLTINLTDYYFLAGYPAYLVVRRVGTGFGAFTGAGVNFNVSDDAIIQLVYNPTYEGINLGANTRLKWQHSVGLRAYYKL
jgi:hypothetical protein